MNKENILEIRDLAISFKTVAGTVNAIRGVSLDLKRGCTLAIVGESGSGKSVTVKSIAGIIARPWAQSIPSLSSRKCCPMLWVRSSSRPCSPFRAPSSMKHFCPSWAWAFPRRWHRWAA